MKNTIKIIAVVVILIMTMSLFTGCNTKTNTKDIGIKNTDIKRTTQNKEKIGVSFATSQEERWVRDRDSMQDFAKTENIDLLFEVANNDALEQESQCGKLISQGIKVLILEAQDTKAAATIVDKAHKSGVKVIAYDRMVMGADVDVYLSFDNNKVGELQGKWFTEHLDKGNIVWLAGSPADNNARLFKQGAAKYLKPKIDKGDYKVIKEEAVYGWKPENALKIMQEVLKTNKNIDGVLAPNDGTAGACIQAMSEQGIKKVLVTGQDAGLAAAKRVIEGTQGMTVFKDTRELGKVAISTAVKMAEGKDLGINNKVNNEKISVPSILLDPVVVDKDNLDKILIDSSYLNKEDVY